MNSKYLNQGKLENIKFKNIGNNIKISENVTIIGAKNITLGSNVRIDDYCIISAKNGALVIGDDVHIGGQTYLGCAGELIIGKKVNIAQGVKIYTKSNDYTHADPNNDNFIIGKILIGDYVTIGPNSVLVGDLNIGEGATIGALSFVKNDLKPWSVYAGSPVRFLKKRKN